MNASPGMIFLSVGVNSFHTLSVVSHDMKSCSRSAIWPHVAQNSEIDFFPQFNLRYAKVFTTRGWPSSLPHFPGQYSGLCGRQPIPLAQAAHTTSHLGACERTTCHCCSVLVLSVSATRVPDTLFLLQIVLLANPPVHFLSCLK